MHITLLSYGLQEHTGRVFRLQFDEFQIVSSSHDDTILIWDFLNYKNTGATALGEFATQQAAAGVAAAVAAAQPLVIDQADADPSDVDEGGDEIAAMPAVVDE